MSPESPPPSSGPPVDGELMDALVQVSFAVATALNRVGAHHDMSSTQIRLLGVLRDRTPQLGELAQLLGLEKSTVSGLVDRASRRGLVERRPSSTGDQRAVEVVMTPTGHALAMVGAAEVSSHLAPLVDRLPAGDRRRLKSLLVALLTP